MPAVLPLRPMAAVIPEDVVTVRAREEPTIPGYRCIGWVSNNCWPEWVEWVLMREVEV